MASSMKQIPATALTANDSTSKEELGRLRIESDGKEYRYVRLGGAVASRTGYKGDVALWQTSSNYQVCVTAAAARRNAFAGVFIGTITKAYYGWVQCGGYNTYLHTDTSASRGALLVVHSTTSRIARNISNTAQLLAFGHAMKDNSGSILTSCILTRD